jgi:hypothetical protein
MNNNTKWLASWVDNAGNKRTYTFHGPNSRVVARVDFQLQLMEQKEPVPDEFELEEAWIAPPRPQIQERHV